MAIIIVEPGDFCTDPAFFRITEVWYQNIQQSLQAATKFFRILGYFLPTVPWQYGGHDLHDFEIP
jgi:hypothetical protein